MAVKHTFARSADLHQRVQAREAHGVHEARVFQGYISHHTILQFRMVT
jgi:hypothetical protein